VNSATSRCFLATSYWQQSKRNRNQRDDRSSWVAIDQEAVKKPIKLVHRQDVYLHDKAVLTGHTITRANLGELPYQFSNTTLLTGVRSDADIGGKRQPKRRWVDLQAAASCATIFSVLILRQIPSVGEILVMVGVAVQQARDDQMGRV